MHTKCFALLGILAMPLAPSPAPAFVLSVESREVVPGSEFDVDLLGNLEQPIRGYQVGLEFPEFALELVGVTLEGTAIGGRQPAVFERSTGSGFGTLRVLLDVAPPFENPIPAGEAVRLARLRFQVSQGLAPGAEYTINLESNLGFPPLPALVYSGAEAVTPGLTGGVLRVFNRNLLRIRDLSDVKPNSVETVEFSAFNLEPLMGFSLGVRFDPSLLQFLETSIKGTITEAVGAEFVTPIIDNNRGFFVLGVILDQMPPFDHQVIPAAGLDLTIAKATVRVGEPPPGTSSAELELADGVSDPPIQNLFVIENLSVPPDLMNGTLSFLNEGLFVRGDVNEDGVVDISDPISIVIWIFLGGPAPVCQKRSDSDDDGRVGIADVMYSLVYQFQGSGLPFPAPFPTEGLDPTPDELSCPAQ